MSRNKSRPAPDLALVSRVAEAVARETTEEGPDHRPLIRANVSNNQPNPTDYWATRRRRASPPLAAR